MNQHPFIPYKALDLSDNKIEERTQSYYQFVNARRSVRDFSTKAVSKKVIRDIIMTASTAPSGAHKQPWSFCAVSNPETKSLIRQAAEVEEYLNYTSRMSEEWLEDLSALGTDWNKPFLEDSPWLIVVFKRVFDFELDRKRKNYYVSESVGIACGFLINAIHNAGLVTLTHTPSPMNFLQKILKRPINEKAYLLLPVGYPAQDAKVPDLKRKKEKDVCIFYE